MKFFTLLLAMAFASVNQVTEATETAPNVVQTVMGQIVNLRAGPHIKQDVVAKLHKGETVLVHDREGKWYGCYVWRDGERVEGWVYQNLITPISDKYYDAESAKAAVSQLVSQDGA